VLGIRIVSLAAAVVLVAYVVASVADADLGGSATAVRVVVLAAAAVVAVVGFQSWSHRSTPHTLSAMVIGLLGGASLASSITTSSGDALYGSEPMALVGTLAIVAAATIAQIGQTRTNAQEAAR
jgi:hypothetical protein